MTIKEFDIQNALGSLSYTMKIKLAINFNTPTEILTKLLIDKDNIVRYHIANNSNASVKILTILSKDKDYYVRCWVACNPNTPKEILTILSKDKNFHVRDVVNIKKHKETHT